MEILTWSDPKYFVYLRGLVGSLRYHENEHTIITYLLDFDDYQIDQVRELYKNDSKIVIKRLSSIDTQNYDVIDNKGTFNPDVQNGKIQFYRNFRPRVFLNELKNSPTGKLCTFGANGLVFSKLNYIEDHLDENDFVFMEREKPNMFTYSPTTVSCIEDVVRLVQEQEIDLDEILMQATGKVVLLGTHAMRQSEATYSVLERWIELIENTDAMNMKFSDMNLFVKAYAECLMDKKYDITKETGLGLPREENPFCDTQMIEGNKIWFAKGSSKFTSETYHKMIHKFVNYKYSL